jgi:C_GCAxxG_C_C family probable redox protein
MSTEELCQKALTYFRSGYNCAQSVLLTLFEYIDPESKNDLIPRIATGFGGGIGRCGSVCGALTGGIIVVGIKYGTNEVGLEKRAKAYTNAQTLFKQFEKQHGSVMCRDLFKYDLSDPQQAAEARQNKAFEKVCHRLIKSVIESYLALEKHTPSI